jgi:hypothetical protein
MSNLASIKQMAQKTPLCLPTFVQKFSAHFRLQPLCLVQYFGAFFQNAVAIKNIKKYLRKSCSALSLKL